VNGCNCEFFSVKSANFCQEYNLGSVEIIWGNGSSLGYSIYIRSTTREVDIKHLFPKVDLSVPFHFWSALDRKPSDLPLKICANKFNNISLQIQLKPTEWLTSLLPTCSNSSNRNHRHNMLIYLCIRSY